MIGGWEWVIIVLAILLVFGAKRIPEIAKGLGQGIRSFKRELHADDEKPRQDEQPPKKDDSPATL